MQNTVHYQHSASNVLVFNGNNSWEILLHTYKKSNARSALKAHEENDSYSHFTEHQNWLKSSLSNSNFNDSSQNNSISKSHTSGCNVVLASPPQPTAYRPNSFQHHPQPWGKESLQHSLKSDQVLTGPYLRRRGEFIPHGVIASTDLAALIYTEFMFSELSLQT